MTPLVLRCGHCHKKAYYRSSPEISWVSCCKCGQAVECRPAVEEGTERRKRIIDKLEA